MVKIINGKNIAKQREKRLAREVADFKKKAGVFPKLVAVMVGDDAASRLYLRVKEKAAKRVGILFEKREFPTEVNPDGIIEFIKKTKKNSSVHGIMVQLPLPKQSSIINQSRQSRGSSINKSGQSAILVAIAPSKDVDCLTPENLGLLMMGKPRFLPATVKAVETALKEAACGAFFAYENASKKIIVASRRQAFRFAQKHHFASFLNEFLEGVDVVVVGAGNLVGKPLAVYLKSLGATVTICDEFTRDLTKHTKRAEILISATGVPGLIKKEMVKKKAVVIDVGSPEGDVDFEEVKKVASAITPVPGGVGPLTVISLLENTLLAARSQFFPTR